MEQIQFEDSNKAANRYMDNEIRQKTPNEFKKLLSVDDYHNKSEHAMCLERGVTFG